MNGNKKVGLLEQTREILLAPTLNTKRLILLFTNITFFIAISGFVYSQGGFQGLPDPSRDTPTYILLLFVHGISFIYNLAVVLNRKWKGLIVADWITSVFSVLLLMIMSQMIIHAALNTSFSFLLDFSFSVILIGIVAFLWGRIASVIWTAVVFVSLFFAANNINTINGTDNKVNQYSYNFLTKSEANEFNQGLAVEIVSVSGLLGSPANMVKKALGVDDNVWKLLSPIHSKYISMNYKYPKKIKQRVGQMLNIKAYLSRPDIFKRVYIPNLIKYIQRQKMSDYEGKQTLIDVLRNAKNIKRFQTLIKEKKVPIPLPLTEIIWIAFIILFFFPVFFQSSMLGNILKAVPRAITNIEKASEEQKKLLEENLRLGAEVGIAKQIQEMALPNVEDYNNFDKLDVSGFMVSSAEVGGDYYEVIPVLENDSCFLAIGDVTDHGLQSGIVMLMAQTAFRTAIETTNNLINAIISVNRAVYENTERMKDPRNLTLSLMYFKENRLSVTGQHESILLLKKNSDSIDEISTSDLGMYIGMIPDVTEYCSEISFHINKDDIVVFYTDGVTEAENPSKELYGIDRLKSVIVKNRELNATELNNAIYEDIKGFIATAPVYDDITLLSLKGKKDVDGGKEEISIKNKGVIKEMKGDVFENKSSIQVDRFKLEKIKFYGAYNYVPDDFIPDDSFLCSLRASDLINNWHRCGLISDNLSNYFSHYKDNENEKKNLINVFSTISNELVENLAKFSDKRRNTVRINVNKYASIFCIETENFVQEDTVKRFEDYVANILDEKADHEQMYMDRLMNREEGDKNSGLGYLMLLKDFPVKIGCSVAKVAFTEGSHDEDKGIHRINIRTYLFWEEL